MIRTLGGKEKEESIRETQGYEHNEARVREKHRRCEGPRGGGRTEEAPRQGGGRGDRDGQDTWGHRVTGGTEGPRRVGRGTQNQFLKTKNVYTSVFHPKRRVQALASKGKFKKWKRIIVHRRNPVSPGLPQDVSDCIPLEEEQN